MVCLLGPLAPLESEMQYKMLVFPDSVVRRRRAAWSNAAVLDIGMLSIGDAQSSELVAEPGVGGADGGEGGSDADAIDEIVDGGGNGDVAD